MNDWTALRITVVGLQVLSAIAAGVAAYLWWKSAKVTTPGRFIITVIKPDMKPLGEPLGGKYMGHGYSEELTRLGAALVGQSRLSGYGAQAAAVAAAFQALAIFVDAVR